MTNGDYASLSALVNERFDGLEKTLTARLEAVDQRRESGDRSIAQLAQFNENRVGAVIKDVGNLAGKVERVESDLNRALAVHREELAEELDRAVTKLVNEMQRSLRERDDKRIVIEKDVGIIKRKLDAIKWAALGVGVGSGITSGSVVALLAGVL